MQDRSLVSDTRQSLGKPPQTALRPVQRRQQQCHRAECAPLTAILLVITWPPLTTSNYVCWSNCSSLSFSLLASLARYTLLHWTEVRWNLKLWKKELNNLSLINSIRFPYSCPYSLRGLDSEIWCFVLSVKLNPGTSRRAGVHLNCK